MAITLGGATFTNPNAIIGPKNVNASVPSNNYSKTGSLPSQPTIGEQRANTSNIISTAAPVTAQAVGSAGQVNNVSATNTAAQQAANAAAAAQQQAAAVEAQRISNLTAQINDQVTRANAASRNSVGAATTSYNASAQNLVDQTRAGQNAINSARQNISVGQINSIKGLIQTIQQGINSGRVMLGNSNALDSSAAGALGRAYQQYGETERNGINNNAAIAQNEQDKAQTELNTQQQMGLRTLNATRDNVIAQIGNDLESQLASIDANAAAQGLTGKVDIAGLKQQAVQQARDQLAGIDNWLQQQNASVTPQTTDQVSAEAYRLSNLGVSGTPFSYDTAALTTPQQQFGGADISSLPLYTRPRTEI